MIRNICDRDRSSSELSIGGTVSKSSSYAGKVSNTGVPVCSAAPNVNLPKEEEQQLAGGIGWTSSRLN